MLTPYLQMFNVLCASQVYASVSGQRITEQHPEYLATSFALGALKTKHMGQTSTGWRTTQGTHGRCANPCHSQFGLAECPSIEATTKSPTIHQPLASTIKRQHEHHHPFITKPSTRHIPGSTPSRRHDAALATRHVGGWANKATGPWGWKLVASYGPYG